MYLLQYCYSYILPLISVQKLDLQKVPLDDDIDCSNVRGQIVVSVAGRDRGGGGGPGGNMNDVSLVSESGEDCCGQGLSPEEIIPLRRESRLPHGSVPLFSTS